MAKFDLTKLLSENEYPGRGIVIGKSKDGKKAMIAYFIMGRSENSRNRVFEEFDGGMRTKAFDESKLVDPSLIIYNPFLTLENIDIITNGDQTDTVYNYIKENGDDGFSFDKALFTREFEPDSPNFTPRISGILNIQKIKNMILEKPALEFALKMEKCCLLKRKNNVLLLVVGLKMAKLAKLV